eukprot:6585812-Pyramimonas_sp.AAC.1
MRAFQVVRLTHGVSLDLFIDNIGLSGRGSAQDVLAGLKVGSAAVYRAVANDTKTVVAPEKAAAVASDPGLGHSLFSWLDRLSGQSGRTDTT